MYWPGEKGRRWCWQNDKFKQFQAANLRGRGTLGDFVGSRLHHYDLDQTNIVLKLVMKCTDQSPSLRPTMSQVVAVHEGEKTLEDISEEIAPSISPAWVPDGQYIYRVFCHVSISIDSSFFFFFHWFVSLDPPFDLNLPSKYWRKHVLVLKNYGPEIGDLARWYYVISIYTASCYQL